MSVSGFAQFIPLILIFVIFYFLLIRPQQKRVAEHKLMITKLTRGDTVVTAGGIVGKITRIIDDEKADLEIAENINVKIIKSTISQILSKSETK
jgi:preprotein translocase subunit YajC